MQLIFMNSLFFVLFIELLVVLENPALQILINLLVFDPISFIADELLHQGHVWIVFPFNFLNSLMNQGQLLLTNLHTRLFRYLLFLSVFVL